jgi:hypothetical protein
MLETYTDAWAAMHLALISDEAGESAARDAALAAITAPPAGKRVARGDLVAIARMVQDAYTKGAGAKIDPKAMDKLESQLDTFSRASADYFIARFCDRFGQNDDAQRYYIRSVAGPAPSRVDLVLAAVQLRARGIEPINLPREKPAASPASPSPEEP